MKRSVMTLVAIGTLVASGAFAAEPEWITQSNQFTQLLLDVNAKYSPEAVADAGLEQPRGASCFYRRTGVGIGIR